MCGGRCSRCGLRAHDGHVDCRHLDCRYLDGRYLDGRYGDGRYGDGRRAGGSRNDSDDWDFPIARCA